MKRGIAIAMMAAGLGGCTPPPPAAPQAVILRAALRQPVNGLDPAHATEFNGLTLVARVYEPLYQYKYDGRPDEVEPALAAAMPSLSRDGRTVTIKLREGVRFQADACLAGSTAGLGREVSAQDFVESWRRLLDPATASPNRWILDDRVASFRAVGPRTLELKLKKPQPSLAHLLAMPATAVVPIECVQTLGADFAFHPVGTGPFRLKSHSSKRFEWERNPDYRDKNLPALDGIVDDVIFEDQPAWLAFEKGEHDYLMRIPVDRQLEGDVMETGGRRLLRSPAADFTYFAFNMMDPVVGGRSPARRSLRKAMALAYDRGPLIDAIYRGQAQRAQFLLPPSVPGYDAKYRSPYDVSDLNKAKALLVKAGYPEGKGLPELVLDAPTGAANRIQGEYFQRAMARIGIKVRVNLSSWPELLARARRKQGQIYAVSWVYDYPGAENGLALLYGPNASPGPNKSNYGNPAYDRLFDKYQATRPGKRRAALIKAMRRIFEEDAPWILGVHRHETRLLHPWVKNYRIHLFQYGIEKYLRLAQH